MNILIGLIMVIIGFLQVKYTLWFVTNFGRIPWFETHLHTFGGTFLFYKLLGILFSFFGILHITGLLQPFIQWLVGLIFGPVFPGLN